MSFLYLTDNELHVGISANYIELKLKNEIVDRIPIETVDAINLYGRAQLTTQFIQICLKKSIPIMYYTKQGIFLGRTSPAYIENVCRQRIQAVFDTSDTALRLAQRVIYGKIHNQMVVLRRYAKNRDINIKSDIQKMQIYQVKASLADSIASIRGYEGMAARTYFTCLGKLVDEDFKFKGRSKRPPLDPFNALLSLGYSILMNEVFGKIEAKGLNAYFGFIHQDAKKHPTLASDLMEEWRPVIIDTTIMSMISRHEIRLEHFQSGLESDGIYLTKEGMKIFFAKIEAKFRQENKYLSYVDRPVSFRRAIELQINAFTHVLEENDVKKYQPVIIR